MKKNLKELQEKCMFDPEQDSDMGVRIRDVGQEGFNGDDDDCTPIIIQDADPLESIESDNDIGINKKNQPEKSMLNIMESHENFRTSEIADDTPLANKTAFSHSIYEWTDIQKDPEVFENEHANSLLNVNECGQLNLFTMDDMTTDSLKQFNGHQGNPLHYFNSIDNEELHQLIISGTNEKQKILWFLDSVQKYIKKLNSIYTKIDEVQGTLKYQDSQLDLYLSKAIKAFRHTKIKSKCRDCTGNDSHFYEPGREGFQQKLDEISKENGRRERVSAMHVNVPIGLTNMSYPKLPSNESSPTKLHRQELMERLGKNSDDNLKFEESISSNMKHKNIRYSNKNNYQTKKQKTCNELPDIIEDEPNSGFNHRPSRKNSIIQPINNSASPTKQAGGHFPQTTPIIQLKKYKQPNGSNVRAQIVDEAVHNRGALNTPLKTPASPNLLKNRGDMNRMIYDRGNLGTSFPVNGNDALQMRPLSQNLDNKSELIMPAHQNALPTTLENRSDFMRPAKLKEIKVKESQQNVNNEGGQNSQMEKLQTIEKASKAPVHKGQAKQPEEVKSPIRILKRTNTNNPNDGIKNNFINCQQVADESPTKDKLVPLPNSPKKIQNFTMGVGGKSPIKAKAMEKDTEGSGFLCALTPINAHKMGTISPTKNQKLANISTDEPKVHSQKRSVEPFLNSAPPILDKTRKQLEASRKFNTKSIPQNFEEVVGAHGLS